MKVLTVRNVNEALPMGIKLLRGHGEKIAPRGLRTLEYPEPVCTKYCRPREKVMFHPKRDANPFFHFFESLWILAGRNDVDYVARFLPRIADYSDDGETFHGAYGYRLRCFDTWDDQIDQLNIAAEMLRRDPDTRQVVLQIWDAQRDLGAKTKDVPCNDLVMVKVRNGMLNISVANRSNDIIWGAYGANAVQFAFLQEYLAAKVGVQVGTYRQVSDSYHVYIDNPQFKKLGNMRPIDPYNYRNAPVEPYPWERFMPVPETWDRELWNFMEDPDSAFLAKNPFFCEVALPMWNTFSAFKNRRAGLTQAAAIQASDWQRAVVEWLKRRDVTA